MDTIHISKSLLPNHWPVFQNMLRFFQLILGSWIDGIQQEATKSGHPEHQQVTRTSYI